MRTLIIDNEDSFTYNLAHLVFDVTGVKPQVVRNDEPGWTPRDLEHFDNVIISPGPGRPERAADFGVCAQTIREATRPLLGVCLGHQGICSVFGGDVEAAPEPVHGLLSPVVHGQVDILAGIPSPFSAVRYHSLAATRLPAELEAIAWTPDGVLMAVRHRHRPIWGVQFHPESVCTDHGHRLLRNFAELTTRWQAQHGGVGRQFTIAAGRVARDRRSTTVDTPPPAPPPSGWRRVVHRETRLDVAAERVFDSCYRWSEHAFWLDSALQHASCGRFSFMGDASGPLARIATADAAGGNVTIRSRAGTEVVEGALLDWVDADLRAHRVGGTDLPFGFALGWVGYLGYELKAQCGAARAHRSPYADAAMIFADRAIVFDHLERRCHLLALAEGADDEAAYGWLAETADRLSRLAGEPPPAPPGPLPVAALGSLGLLVDRDRYLRLIADCKLAIAAGETYEVCLTNMVSAEGTLDPWHAYRLLRRDNPAPFGALLRLGSLSVLGCSPERFVSVSGDGLVESKPIKGTRPRATSGTEDERLRRDLRLSPKDRAENLMIVDLVRNDLGTCAEAGSVRVDTLFEVETYPTVHQLVSTVRAQLRTDRSAVDCVRACFPGGSMTGAPKVRTMSILDDLEPGPRGVYSGALGYFSLSGAADFSIVIRTMVVEPGRVSFGVGGAITVLSDPDEEFEETAVKATPFLRLLGQEFPERSAGRA